MDKSVLDALNAIDPSSLNYAEWIDVGMALKAEGASCSVWDDWSAKDGHRYHPGECDRKWDTFNSSGVTAGTIMHMAEQQGYKPNQYLSWDDSVEDTVISYYEDVLLANKQDIEPWEMAINYLVALFDPDDIVGYVHSAKFDEDRQKWVPENAGTYQKQKKLIQNLKKYKSFDTAFGTINEEAGAWIRINALDGKGAGDKNVTRFTHALVEADTMTIEEQKKFLIGSKLPIAALLESGGKSVHAVIKIDAKDKTEFKQRVDFLFDWLNKHKFVVDEANKNPSRLSRLPGVMRNGKCQTLLATDIGCASWNDWLDEINGVDDDLPPIVTFGDQMANPPQLSPELIGGILRRSNKMIITGESKAGKTCLSQNLAVCVAEGIPWLGKFKCEQCKVLYMNLEVEEASLFHRFMRMYEALEIKPTPEGLRNIHLWNLRGHAVPLDKLADKIIRRCRGQNYGMIILDPLYKVQQGDENSAEMISIFCNALDRISHETGAAIIYDHHHPKGAARSKVIDRGAGSGVFARDADAICDLSFLDPSKEILETIGMPSETGEKPMQISFVLRDFKDIEPQNCFFAFPVHRLDTAGLLDGAAVEGSAEAGRQKSANNQMSDKERIEMLDTLYKACLEGDRANLSEMVAFAGGKPTEKTLRRWIKTFGGFVVEDGYIKKQ